MGTIDKFFASGTMAINAGFNAKGIFNIDQGFCYEQI
jgi:hypothetical protein